MKITANLLLIALVSVGLNAMAGTGLNRSGHVFSQFEMANPDVEGIGANKGSHGFKSGGAIELSAGALGGGGFCTKYICPEAMMEDSKMMTGMGVHIDLPMVTRKEKGSYAFARHMAQAYITNHYASGVMWQMGQFDTLLDSQANDINERAFVTPSIHKNALVGIHGRTHSGAHVGYTKKNMHVGILLANGNGENIQKDKHKNQMGFDLMWKGGMFNVGLVHLRTPFNGDKKTQSTWDMVGNWNQGPFGARVQYTQVQNLEGEEMDDPVVAMTAQAVYRVTKQGAVIASYSQVKGFKGENLFELSGGDALKVVTPEAVHGQWTIGYNHMMDNGMNIKAELNSNSLKLNDNMEGNWRQGALAIVHNF